VDRNVSVESQGAILEHEAIPPRASGIRSAGPVAWWAATPLYLQILIGLVLGVITGLALGPKAGWMDLPSRLILRLLGALAPPLILVAVVRALMTAQVRGRIAVRMIGLLARMPFT
jgi:Na+/H+-dicarboxylate symporter